MGLFGLKLVREKKYVPNHVFSDDERESGLEIQKLKREQKKLKETMEVEKLKLEVDMLRAEIDEKRSELYDDDEDVEPQDLMNPDALFMSLIGKILGGNMQVQQPMNPVPISTPVVAKKSLSNEELLELKKAIDPKHLKLIKVAPKEILESEIRKRLPEVDDDTITRAMAMLKQ
jgi:hypothetical protein